MSLLKHLPNTLTSLNLLSGCAGIMYSFTERIDFAIYCIWLAMVFDFFDGFAARLLRVSSPIGKELDSLADMVTFGVLPAMIMFQLLSNFDVGWIPYVAFSIAIFSALRLAKFNVDDNQDDEFIGVPTPANALFVSSLFFLLQAFPEINRLWVLVTITVITSAWLVVPLRLLSLKFKSYDMKENSWRYVLLLTCLGLLVALKLTALPIIIIVYIVLSVMKSVFAK